MNRVKGLDLIDRLPEELWMEVCEIVQEAAIKPISKKKKCKKTKWLSKEALQIAEKRREVLYSQQKQDWELTIAQIMNSLLPNSD